MQGTSKVQSFRDLQVWQRSMEMTVLVYRLTQGFPREEQYGITSQLRRAAVSVAGNIAEGQGRLNRGEFTQFLGIARGSNCEVQTLLEIARELGFGDTVMRRETCALSEEIAKMLHRLIASLRVARV
jgi:four helix bundle protein